MTEQPIEIAELKDGENQLSTPNKHELALLNQFVFPKGPSQQAPEPNPLPTVHQNKRLV
jgi:hypothetical protein